MNRRLGSLMWGKREALSAQEGVKATGRPASPPGWPVNLGWKIVIRWLTSPTQSLLRPRLFLWGFSAFTNFSVRHLYFLLCSETGKISNVLKRTTESLGRRWGSDRRSWHSALSPTSLARPPPAERHAPRGKRAPPRARFPPVGAAGGRPGGGRRGGRGAGGAAAGGAGPRRGGAGPPAHLPGAAGFAAAAQTTCSPLPFRRVFTWRRRWRRWWRRGPCGWGRSASERAAWFRSGRGERPARPCALRRGACGPTPVGTDLALPSPTPCLCSPQPSPQKLWRTKRDRRSWRLAKPRWESRRPPGLRWEAVAGEGWEGSCEAEASAWQPRRAAWDGGAAASAVALPLSPFSNWKSLVRHYLAVISVMTGWCGSFLVNAQIKPLLFTV